MNDTSSLINAIQNLQNELERQNLRGEIKIMMPKDDIIAVSFRAGRDFGRFLVSEPSSGHNVKMAGARFVEAA